VDLHSVINLKSNTRTNNNVLSLCSGVGALDLGYRLAVPTSRTVCYVEIEAYCCAVLVSRMSDKALDDAPIWTNLKTFDGRPWRGIVDCITGGYPCQPFSNAGLRRGTDDPRHLWPYIADIIRIIQPRECFFENVSGHLTLGFREVRAELKKLVTTLRRDC
jgi:DNA (cytosine-5)-methyltransferase 1